MTLTHQGGTGYTRDSKTGLYLLATTMFAGEKTFHEQSADPRAVTLARELAVTDWAWTASFLAWLRTEANIRTMSLMLAAEAVHARLGAHAPGAGLPHRELIGSVIQRPDEPAEILQYWLNTHGRAVPMPIKRGVGDAATRLYTQAAALRWDGKGPMEFADILELTHPKPRHPVQDIMFRYLLDTRHHGPVPAPPELTAIGLRRTLSQMTPADRHDLAAKMQQGDQQAALAVMSAAAGQWEWLLSWLGENPANGKALTKREQWELIIPAMGYMGILRNLRNFDQAGLKESLAQKIRQRISNPIVVAESRQFPFRFLSAWKAAPSIRWANALEIACQHSVPSIPALPGRTLILIDMSGSMNAPLSNGRPYRYGGYEPGRPTRMEAAALFGAALAIRNTGRADVWGFADTQMRIGNIKDGASILKTVRLITDQSGKIGHGTAIEYAVRQTYQNHDRVIILTDMQTMPTDNGHHLQAITGDVASAVPAQVHVYGFNLAGYEHTGMAPSPYRHELGGLTDHTFSLIPLIEQGTGAHWPWEKS